MARIIIPPCHSLYRHARLSDPEMIWLPMEHTPSVHGVPTSAMFDDGNGGEFRQSLLNHPPMLHLPHSCWALTYKWTQHITAIAPSHGCPYRPPDPPPPCHNHVHDRQVSARVRPTIRATGGFPEQNQRRRHASGHLAPGKNELDRLALRARPCAETRAGPDHGPGRHLQRIARVCVLGEILCWFCFCLFLLF